MVLFFSLLWLDVVGDVFGHDAGDVAFVLVLPYADAAEADGGDFPWGGAGPLGEPDSDV